MGLRGTLRKKAQRGLKVEWILPVVCDFSGFFVELLGYIVELNSRFDPTLAIRGLSVCTDSFLETLGPDEATALRAAQVRAPR